MDKHSVASTYPALNLEDKITLAGAVRKYWSEISAKWCAERTITGNIADYEKRILQKANPLKALSEYSKEDFDEIIRKLSEEGDYDEGTEEHYRHLIRLIVKCSNIGGEILHDSLIKINKEKTGNKKNTIIQSFSEMEEKAIYDWICSLDGHSISGTTLAVVLMFLYGFRNQECAGLTFTSLDCDTNHLIPMLRIYQTTITHSRATKLRGKTYNAQREIPCLNKKSLELIESRMERIKADNLKNGIEIPDVLIPICGCDKNHLIHCTTEEITNRAKLVFSDLGIEGNTWKELLSPEQLEEVEIIKQDANSPQCYALRRNAITRFYSYPISLREEELHYIAGHEIDVNNVLRTDYTNYDVMSEIVQKMEKHKYYR